MFDRENVPSHLFNLRPLSFEDDLFCKPLDDSWFKLGIWAIKSIASEERVIDVIERQAVLIQADGFPEIVDELGVIGNTFHRLGQPTDYITENNRQRSYKYNPFHEVRNHKSLVGEPLVFCRFLTSDIVLFINPDIYLFHELEERISDVRTLNVRSWWDVKKGEEVIRRSRKGNIETVEIKKRLSNEISSGSSISSSDWTL